MLFRSQARAAGRADETARLEAERATESARLDGMSAEQRVLVVRALVPGIVVTSRPERLTGRWVELGQRLLELGQPDSLEIRIALTGAGATQVRPGQGARLVFHADGHTLAGRVGSVALSSAPVPHRDASGHHSTARPSDRLTVPLPGPCAAVTCALRPLL